MSPDCRTINKVQGNACIRPAVVQGVETGAPVYHIGARLARQGVIPFSTQQTVIARTTAQHVLTGATVQLIHPRISRQTVSTLPAP